MRKALVREIAPITVLDWIEAEDVAVSIHAIPQLAKGHLGTLPVGWHQACRQTSVATEMSIGP
jgi:hypothetical protein